MANCLDYAKIAYAAYFKATAQYYAEPPGHMVDDWRVQKWESGTFWGDGFQGGIWQNDTDVVVGCCGTNPKQIGKFLSDLSADIRIGFGILPNQCSSARAMVKAAKQVAAGRRVSVTGHSLGGGLAQVVGVWENVPFVTFNAPAMARSIKLSHANIFKPQMMARSWSSANVRDVPGVNVRIAGDLVSTSDFARGDHVGMVVDLRNATGGGAHGKGNCWQAVLETDWANIDPFEGL